MNQNAGVINLLSDTVTKPTPGMLEAMMHAEVGDDVFGMDPSINTLEAYVADLFGREAALFCPSGTMTNQIAIHLNTRPLDEILCDKTAHVYLYELGGYSFNSRVGITMLDGENGKIRVPLIASAIKPDVDWMPRTSLVCIENSCNQAGGNYYTVRDLEPIYQFCRKKNLRLHLDGARLFNVLVETGETPAQYGALFDTISICLSKGLGAPVGSLLIGDREAMRHARKLRKVMGGGMRQAGYLAAAGMYALKNHVERLRTDNARAKTIAAILHNLPFVRSINPVRTNIIVFHVDPETGGEEVIKALKRRGILASQMGRHIVRFVFHLDITDSMMDRLVHILHTLKI